MMTKRLKNGHHASHLTSCLTVHPVAFCWCPDIPIVPDVARRCLRLSLTTGRVVQNVGECFLRMSGFARQMVRRPPEARNGLPCYGAVETTVKRSTFLRCQHKLLGSPSRRMAGYS